MRRLTVITVSLRYDKCLLETIKSVTCWISRAQDYTSNDWSFGYIVVHSDSKFEKMHGGSTCELDFDTFYVPASGVYSAMNEGISKISDGYVWFVNAGDTCLVDSVSDVIDALHCSPCMLRAQSKYVGFNQEWLAPSHSKIYDFRNFSHQALIIDRHLIARGFDQRFNISGDKELYYRCLTSCECVVTLRLALCVMSVGGISQNGRQEFRKLYEDMVVDSKYGFVSYRIVVLRFFKTLYKFLGSKILPYNLYYKILSRFVR